MPPWRTLTIQRNPSFMHFRFLSPFLLVLSLAACGPSPDTESESADAASASTRWYGAQQIALGESVFRQNCAVCHGEQAQGTVADWRSRLDDGSFPPPPLNGSAHAWHHPRSVLLQVINNGGIALGGQMPGFADILDEEEKLAAIAYFPTFWSDDIYADWQDMGGVN